MQTDFQIQTASLSPIELLKEGKELVGDQYWLFVGITFVGGLIGGAIPIVLIGPMMVGIYLCYLARERRENVEFGLLFKGFDFFVESLIAAIIMAVVAFVVSFVAYILLFVVGLLIGLALGESLVIVSFIIFFFLYLLFFVVIILVHTPFLFIFPLIAEHKLKGVDAVKTSFAGVKQNFVPCAIMVVVFGLIYMLASLACIIPAYLFAPIAIGGVFTAYRRIFPPQGFAQKPVPGAPQPTV